MSLNVCFRLIIIYNVYIFRSKIIVFSICSEMEKNDLPVVTEDMTDKSGGLHVSNLNSKKY